MSRKNHNAKRNQYQRTDVNRIMNDLKLEQAAQQEKVSEECGENRRYEFRRLPSDLLLSDTSYQRPVDEKRVRKIVEEFDPRLVNAVKVSNRNGRFYVFDGAHTLAALKIVHGGNRFDVMCKVYSGLTFEEEAYLFARQTGESKEVGFSNRLNALLLSKDERALAFQRDTESVGLRLSTTGYSKGVNTICAVAKARQLYDKVGPERYKEILQLVMDTWHGEVKSLTTHMIGGVAVFLATYGDEYNRERFIRKLSPMSYEKLHEDARRRGSSRDLAHAVSMTKAYNRSGGRGSVDERKLTLLL